MSNTLRPKFVASLTLRGFDMPPGEVESLIGATAATLGIRGASTKPGTAPLKRSFARWELEFEDSARLDEMIPALLSSIGGVDHLATAKQSVKPEFIEVDLALWVKDSDEQEGGFIDASSIAMLAKLGATLGLGVYPRNDA